MTTTSQTSDSLYSKESFSNDFTEIDEWLLSFKDENASLTSNSNTKLNEEIHLAITTDPSEYASSLCDHLFILYRDVQQRPFVLQFLPSFITSYYNILHRHTESDDATTKDVCSTIDTFFVALYNLSVLDDGQHDRNYGFRIPNLTLPSVYHTPNSDYYAPTPLTQHAISKHDKKRDIVRLHTFTPFDTVTATTREQILWLLLIQYGLNVSYMDACSRHSFFKMSKKILSQGFPFGEKVSIAEKSSSILPPNGRRIQVSSRIVSEILGILFYFKANSSDIEASECMLLLKQRAEYEMYSDVILMTESLSYLHEFENHHYEQQDTIGIEIELPPTIDMVKQKRTATTSRSIKNRQHTHKYHHESQPAIIENDLSNDTTEQSNTNPVPSHNTVATLVPSTSQHQKLMLDEHGENLRQSDRILATNKKALLPSEQLNETKSPDDNQDVTSPLLGKTNTQVSPPTEQTPSAISPSSPRHYKPLSLTSTQTYFKHIQQQQRVSAPNAQNVQTIIHNETDTSFVRSPTSNMKHGDKKDLIATVRFIGTDSNASNIKETYL